MTTDDSNSTSWGEDLKTDGTPSYKWPQTRLPGWAYLLGATDDVVRRSTVRQVAAHAQKMGRPPTQAEVDAIGEIVTKLIAARSLKPICNISLAAFLAYRTRKVMGFPFWKPKFVLTSPNVFPTLQNPVFTGTRAKRAWHIARFSAYYVVAHFFVVTGLSMYTQAMLMQKFAGDPRLKETFEELKGLQEIDSVIRMRQRRVRQLLARGTKEQLAAELQGLKSGLEAVERDVDNPSSPLHTYSPEKREVVLRKLRQAYHELISKVEERTGGAHDRFTSGNADAHDEAGKLGGSSGPLSSSRGDWATGTTRAGSTTSSQQPGGQGWASGSKGTEAWGDDTGSSLGLDSFGSVDGDDASPVAPSARGASASGGSAWERIRHQARSGVQAKGNPPTSSTDSSSSRGIQTSSSSWDGSPAEQDEEAAKSKAQKEFDEGLERERRPGRDNDSW
ncbi:hypothetical protein SODALDRAFT_329046 [Sodiomyces alkalinus F11]|uniref:Uncharacterized protein n=1 Tax=Sodiomyces alkalinus (strain CBS 110278 / VKM F-3762 / F11) TaxID=1314773 RepID=A0A3N2PKJ5_SODAK|nr:hypothetical protein SODALDRAFT_329046 [Sodiomyces alkalinus F11]ROT34846.1 hypothetical protein SODALDRAFT_329046 [Sodiomyces alkalinus F11]